MNALMRSWISHIIIMMQMGGIFGEVIQSHKLELERAEGDLTVAEAAQLCTAS